MDIGSLTGKLTLEDQMSAVLKKAEDALTKFGETATGQTQKLAQTDSSMSKLSKTATTLGTTFSMLSIPIAAFGGAAVAAGLSVEGAYNTIARKTGETGESLAGLKKDFEVVFASVPNSAQEVATAIADVHQRLGLTGEELQTVTKRFIDFANVNQVDVATATKTVSTLMGALSEGTRLTAAEIGNASSIMDKLTYASQVSGASVGKLAEGVIKGGVAFVQMGFSLDESLALFAQFEKVGANVNDVTSSLGRVMANLAKSGVTDLAGAFKSLITQIKDAPTYADSLRMSIQTFGSIAGPKLAEEIRGGTYSVEALAATLKGLKGTTDNTAKASESFTESLGTLKNQATLAIAPIGTELVNAVKGLIPAIADAIKLVKQMVDLFTSLPQPVQTTVLALGGIVTVAGPLLLAFSSLVSSLKILSGVTGFLGLNTAIASATAALTPFLAAVAGGAIVVGSFAAVVTAGYQAFKLWQESKEQGAAADRQAAIDAANLIRVNKELGKEFKTMDEATAWLTKTNYAAKYREIMGGAKEATPAVAGAGQAAQEAAVSYDILKERMLKLKSEAMQPLSAATKSQIKDLHDWGYTTEEITKALSNVAPQAIKRYVDALEDSDKAAKKTSEEQKKLKEWIADTNREWNRIGPNAFKASEQVSAAAERMAKAIISNDAAMRDAQNDLNELVYKSTVDRTTYELHQLDVLAYNTKLKLDENVANYAEAAAAIDALIARRKSDVKYQQEVDTADDIFIGMADKVPAKWKSAIGSIGAAFGDMFEGVNNGAAQLFKVMGSGLDFIVNKAETTKEKVSAALAMAASMLSTILGEDGGGKLGGAATGALSGAAAGAMFGPIGAGIGAAAGGLLGWISASKKMREENEKANQSLEELRAGLIKTYGSMDNLESTSQRLFGQSFIAEWGHQGVKGLQQFQQFVGNFEERVKAVGEATNKMVSGFGAVTAEMTAPWTQLGDQIGAAHEKTMAAKLAMEEYTGGSVAKIEELKNKYLEASATEDALNTKRQEYATQSAQTLEALGVQAIATFAGVYQATGSWSEALHSISPQLVQLQDSYKALGLETDNVYLKNLMLQANVAEASPQLITAIDGQAAAMQGMAQMGLLNVDTFNAMQQTAMELYIRLQGETANAAAASGDLGDQSRNALLPMQGYLQQAATQAELLGIPLNDNTQMLIDQSKALGIWQEAGVTAQDKLIDGMQSIVDKLDVLLGKLGSMTYSLANMPDAESTVTINHVDTYRSVFYEDERAGGGDAQNRAGGGVIVQNNNYYAGGTEFVPHGSDTVPAMLTPGERVLTTQENKEYTKQQEKAMSTEKLERTLDGIRQDLRRNNDTLLISLQSMLEHAV